MLIFMGLVILLVESSKVEEKTNDLSIKEEKINDIEYDGKELKNTVLTNALSTPSGIVMKTTSDKGSLINFLKPNPIDDWVFSFTITIPQLFVAQHAGVYMWYTSQHIEEGSYLGANKEFEGMVAGIEFSGKTVELVLTANDGVPVEDPMELTIMRDSINHNRFKGEDEITVKVISTIKNFRMEVYGKDNKLIYDNLRFKEASILGERKSGKHFALTSHYERVPHEQKIILKQVSLFKRKEDVNYDPFLAKSGAMKNEPRMYDEIKHENLDTRHLISAIEHYTKYIQTFAGDPAGQSMVSALSDIREEVTKQLEKLLLLSSQLKKNSSSNQLEAVADIGERVKNAEKKVSIINFHIEDESNAVKDLDENYSKKMKLIIYATLVASSAILSMMIFEKLKNRKIQ